MRGLAVICVGPPGSGKTTWAKQFLNEHSQYRRVNMDELGEMLGGGRNGINAKLVKNANSAVTLAIVQAGAIPLIDNTYCNQKSLFAMIGYLEILELDVQINVFETSVTECKRRNSERERQVPNHVIDDMFANLSKMDWGHPVFRTHSVIVHKETPPRFSREEIEKMVKEERLQEHL